MFHRLLPCLLILCAVQQIEAAPKPDVILITIDTLRADHLGVYGHPKIRTPNLDALANKSLLFENAIASAPLTLPSHTSLMTGKYPYHHGIHDNAGRVELKQETLAEILKGEGYNTYAFVGGFPLDHRFGLNQGFDFYDDAFPREKNRNADFSLERSGEAVVESVRKAHFRSPYFLWIHFYDPHAPYLHGGYSGEIEYVDQQIGKLRKFLQFSNSIVAVAGDHGESLGEHGELTHRIFIYDATMRVPFFISAPGLLQKRISKQVRLIDYLPTVLSLLKIKVPSDIDGVPLPEQAGKPALMESLFPKLQLGWAPLIGVRTDQWKYIEAPNPELYNLSADDAEKLNAYKSSPSTAAELRKMIPLIGDTNSSSVSPEMKEELASLGYLGTTGSASGADPKDRIHVWNLIEKAVDLERNRPEDSIKIFLEARKTDPKNPLILSFLAQKYSETERYAEALPLLKDVLRLDPDNSLALYRIAETFLAMGRPLEAKKYALQLERLGNPEAQVLLAKAYLRLQDLKGAKVSLQNATKNDPLDLELKIDLAHVYLQENDVASAESEFQKVLNLDAKNIQALNGLATIAFNKGDLAASEKYLLSAGRIDPSDPQTKMNLALVLMKRGMIREAKELYEAVINEPDSIPEWKEQATQRLRELE